MGVVDVAALRPVGEFGSKAWCEACAEYGAKLLSAADLPPDLRWGFSEIYAHPPARLVAEDRPQAAYFIMVKDGRVSGGDGAPDECRTLPGFHVEIPWGAICNQSASKYGRDGQRQRAAEERVLFAAIADHLGRSDPLGLGMRREAVWPPAVAKALGAGAERGEGLHNIAATLQAPSPEFAALPTTALGVPIFAEMTAAQKARFLELCGVRA